MREKTQKSKRIYSGRLLGLREDEVRLATGKTGRREICEHPGAVAIVAVTRKREIVLIRQFRKPAEKVLLEIPAGLYKRGEYLRSAARRELEEETGFLAGMIRPVFSAYTSPGYSTERLHYFYASKLKKTVQSYEEDEQIEVELVPIDKAFNLVKEGKINDNKTVVGITIAKWMI